MADLGRKIDNLNSELEKQTSLLEKQRFKISDYIFPAITAIILVISLFIQADTVRVQKNSSQIQKEFLAFQKFINRPYLTVNIDSFEASDEGNKIPFKMAITMSNKGSVPARNIKLQKIGSYTFPEERVFDIISGQNLRISSSGEFIAPVKNNYVLIFISYSKLPLTKKKQKIYAILYGARLRRYKGKIKFEPMVIKIDEEAIQYKSSFEMLNRDRTNQPPVWPKIRSAVNSP
jgi:hypothetical protein